MGTQTTVNGHVLPIDGNLDIGYSPDLQRIVDSIRIIAAAIDSSGHIDATIQDENLAMSGTLGLGSDGSEQTLTAGTPRFKLYSTCAGVSGSTNAEPLYVKSILAGAGQVGGRSMFLTYSNVASGGWVNAIKGHMQFGSSGRTTGLASAINAEMTMPNATISSGAYFPLELEMIDAASTSYAGHFGYLYANITGTKTNFDANGVFFWLDGLTAGATKLLSLTSQTLKVKVAAAATTRYLFLSQAEDGLGLGNASAAQSYTAGTPPVLMYFTAAGSGTTNVEPFYVKSTVTGTSPVGGRAKFHTYANVAAGGWLNAIKGMTEFGTSGKVTGLGSAVCAETILSTGTTSGTYSALEAELVADSAVSTGTATSFIYMNIAGSDGTGKTTLNTNGYLFELGSGVVDTANGMFDAVTVGSLAGTHKLRIRICGVNYYIPLNTSLTA